MLEYHLAKAHWMASHSNVHSSPFTRIRIFLNPQLFLSGFKNFYVHTYPFSNRICLSTRIRIHSSAQDSSGIGNRACVVKTGKSREKTLERACHLEYSIHGEGLDLVIMVQSLVRTSSFVLMPREKASQKHAWACTTLFQLQ